MARNRQTNDRAGAFGRPAVGFSRACRAFALALLVVLAAPAGASTEDVRQAIMSQLVEDGYRHITVGKTWLGRLRFVATRPGARREIVVNPVTGEILRDYSRFTDTSDSQGSFDPDDDDDDDFDDDDDDREEEPDHDNSGPGSENSGRDDDRDDTDNSGSGSSSSGSSSDSSDDD